MYTVGKRVCDRSVQQRVGAGGGCAPSSAEREAKGNLCYNTQFQTAFVEFSIYM